VAIMKQRVFVDVDDTLVLYVNPDDCSAHPFGAINGEPFVPNEELIKKLKDFQGDIFIWSGGGIAYARKVAEMVLRDSIEWIALGKHDSFSLVRPGDIVVDDQWYEMHTMKDFGVHVYSPTEEWK